MANWRFHRENAHFLLVMSAFWHYENKKKRVLRGSNIKCTFLVLDFTLPRSGFLLDFTACTKVPAGHGYNLKKPLKMSTVARLKRQFATLYVLRASTGGGIKERGGPHKLPAARGGSQGGWGGLWLEGRIRQWQIKLRNAQMSIKSVCP